MDIQIFYNFFGDTGAAISQHGDSGHGILLLVFWYLFRLLERFYLLTPLCLNGFSPQPETARPVEGFLRH
jgi:hypothetical protein